MCKSLSRKFSKFSIDYTELFNEYSQFRQKLSDDEETTTPIDLSSLEDICLFLHAKTDFENLKKVYRLFLSLPFTTVLCESLFSHMNRIKNEYRSCLLPKNLENLLFLCLYKNFQFDCSNLACKIIKTWKQFQKQFYSLTHDKQIHVITQYPLYSCYFFNSSNRTQYYISTSVKDFPPPPNRTHDLLNRFSTSKFQGGGYFEIHF